MPEPDAYEMVGRYLRGDITQQELRRWLLDSWAMFDAATADERDIAGTAMHFEWIRESGEWTEEAFRRALEHEYRQALNHRPSRVS